MLISLVYALFFVMAEKMDSRVRGNDIRRSVNGRGGKTNSILLINGESVENLWKNSSLKALYNRGFSE